MGSKISPRFSMKFILRYLFTGLLLVFLVWVVYKLNKSSNNLAVNVPVVQPVQNDQKFTIDSSNSNQVVSDKKINLNELYYIGLCLIKEAGKTIIQYRQNTAFAADKKNDSSLVTKADIESHKILVHTLNYKYNDLKVFSEETLTDSFFEPKYFLKICDTYQNNTNDTYVNLKDVSIWIDPLDATQEYSAIQGEPTAGVIHNPFTEITISSFQKEPPKDAGSPPKEKIRVIISRSHSGNTSSEVDEKLKEKADIIVAAGAGYKTINLLHDKADLYYHSTNIYKWDLCAPNAILNNMGGRLTSKDGNNINYSNDADGTSVNGIIAALKNFDYYLSLFKQTN